MSTKTTGLSEGVSLSSPPPKSGPTLVKVKSAQQSEPSKNGSLVESKPNRTDVSKPSSSDTTSRMGVPSSLEDMKSRGLYKALAAEFVGTMFLVLFGCGACNGAGGGVVGIAFAFGLAVGTMAWCIGHISGCHINTAVTFAFLVTRKISIVRALLYMVVQILGAIVGAALLKALTPAGTVTNLGTSTPTGLNAGQVFGVELFITFVLVFTVFATCDQLRGDHAGSGALSIGLSLVLAHLFAVPLTGSGMNPARVLGPAVVSGTWTAHWAYWVGPLVGAAVAAILYDLVFAINASPAKLKGCFTLNYDDSHYTQSGQKETGDNQAEVPLKEQQA